VNFPRSGLPVISPAAPIGFSTPGGSPDRPNIGPHRNGRLEHTDRVLERSGTDFAR
jgi:hypothetical protein